MMLIECIIKRDGPTDQHIGGARYIFKPRPELTDGDATANVCDIQKDEIVEYLLATQFYRRYLPKLKPVSVSAPATPPTPAPPRRAHRATNAPGNQVEDKKVA